jgi:hypothetical protein
MALSIGRSSNHIRSVTLVRAVIICVLFLIFSQSSSGAPKKDGTLVHDWRQEVRGDEIIFISKHSVPFPFPYAGGPEATLAMQAAKIKGGITLSKVVRDEIDAIRKGAEIDELDGGWGRKGGIASYVERIDRHDVAFIEYRTFGVKGRPPGSPRSVRHAIVIKNGQVYFVHLVVMFANHQEEVRGDQRSLIRKIIDLRQ